MNTGPGLSSDLTDLLSLVAEGNIEPEPIVRDEPSLMLQWLAQEYNLPITDLEAAAGDDWPALIDPGADITLQKSFVSAVSMQRLLHAGHPPPHWTESIQCSHCGPVLLWPGQTEPLIRGCPYCHITDPKARLSALAQSPQDLSVASP